MSKVITSPVKKWPGSVTIADPLTVKQAMDIEESLDNANALIPEKSGDTEEEMKAWKNKVAEVVNSARYLYTLLPGLCGCVEKWELAGLGNVTPDNFPGSPKVSRALLFSWLMDEVVKLYREAEEIPNA